MRRISLNEFAAERGQTQAAKLLGLTQGALNKALRVGRDIYVIQHADSSFTAEELRPFPSQAGKGGLAEEVSSRRPSQSAADRRAPVALNDHRGRRESDPTTAELVELRDGAARIAEIADRVVGG